MTNFKERNPELQHLVREHQLLRNHNLTFKQGDAQDRLLLIAEGLVVLVLLERFVRIVVGTHATETDTLPKLLEKAVSRKLLRLPFDDQQDGVRKLKNVRNTILHANFEQAARQAGCASSAEYFQTQFAGEVETLAKISNALLEQIDPSTGLPLA